MLVLLNCSTLFKGGGVQAAVSFIRTALQQKDDIKWNFVLSRRVFDELQGFDLAKELSDVSVVEVSPARNSRSRDALRRLEKEINPDVVFTFFGPAYVSFSKPHLCGVADGWVTHGGYWAWKTMRGIKDVSRSICLVAYKAYMYRKADAWVTEAMIAKKGLARRLCIAERRIGIVPNNCGEHYLQTASFPRHTDPKGKLRILCMAAYYRHKNLEIIPAVAKALEACMPGREFEFVLTLPPDIEATGRILRYAQNLGVSHHLVNVGYVPVNDGPGLYKSCHLLFLPSVLETSSANYPEAMAMGLPIVTVDLDFARSICQQAALYFEPMNPSSAASEIAKLCLDPALWDRLVNKGKTVLAQIPSAVERYEMYRKCIWQVFRFRRAANLSFLQKAPAMEVFQGAVWRQ